MANGKKSFVLYCDMKHTVDLLDDALAGKLFKHLLQYVNDENPETEDLLLKVAFEPIKRQLKRDLKDWEDTREKRVTSGRLGGIESGKSRGKKHVEPNEASASKTKQTQANEAVNVNVNVNDTVIESEIRNILKIISETVTIETKGDDKFIAMIVLKMIEIFKKQFPKYPVNVNFDYPACLQIAYKIAELKKWKKVDVVNGKLNDCLKSWEIIVEFVSNDDWLCTRSIPDINSDKEWARLVQKMAKVKKKSDEPTTTAPRLTHLEPK